jgi:hypothetical protein
VKKAKATAKAKAPPPLDSPNWMPLNEAYKHGCAQAGSSSDFALADLEDGLIAGEVHAKARWLDTQNKPGQKLLERDFWPAFEIRRWQKGVALFPRAKPFVADQGGKTASRTVATLNPRTVIYVWKPDLHPRPVAAVAGHAAAKTNRSQEVAAQVRSGALGLG